MRLADAITLMGGGSVGGYRVSYWRTDGRFATSGHFPEGDEPLFATEEQAWGAARLFAENAPPEYINIDVVDAKYVPVHRGGVRMLRREPRSRSAAA